MFTKLVQYSDPHCSWWNLCFSSKKKQCVFSARYYIYFQSFTSVCMYVVTLKMIHFDKSCCWFTSNTCNNFLFILKRLGLFLDIRTPPITTGMHWNSRASIFFNSCIPNGLTFCYFQECLLILASEPSRSMSSVLSQSSGRERRWFSFITSSEDSLIFFISNYKYTY